MDLEYTFWQMLHLCTSPRVVYRHTKFHKQIKNHWARDDPAFVIIFCTLLAVATSAYCAAFARSLTSSGLIILSVVFFHFLLAGLSIATICWFLSNHYLREEAVHTHVVEQRVEWFYALEIHCNSYFPVFVILYVVQYFLSPLLLAKGFVAVLFSNMLYLVALSYYHYLNFLGYDVLPFLERTTFFLYPVGVLVLLFPLFDGILLQLQLSRRGLLAYLIAVFRRTKRWKLLADLGTLLGDLRTLLIATQLETLVGNICWVFKSVPNITRPCKSTLRF